MDNEIKQLDEIVNKVICGDAIDILKNIPSNCINLVITSPPYYKQREYDGRGIGNEKTVEEYIENLMKVFTECVRVTKSTGSIVFNIGDKYENGSLLLVPYRFALEVLKREKVILVNEITWVKLNPTQTRSNEISLIKRTIFYLCQIKELLLQPEWFLGFS